MTDRYARIRDALKMEPTPGPWRVFNSTDVFTDYEGATGGYHIADCDVHVRFGDVYAELSPGALRANAHLIAACDPDTIRELLAERDQLAAENARLREALRDASTSMQTIADKAGRDEYLMTTDEVRGYANSRANAARAALAHGGEG